MAESLHRVRNNNPGMKQSRQLPLIQGRNPGATAAATEVPGCGTPFSPQLAVSVGRPSSGSAGDNRNRQVRFKAGRARRRVRGERLPGTGGRDDRTGSHIYLSTLRVESSLHMSP